ncbi:hypothetical protein BH20BAC1_BH20BAC1_00560 [soil metagenome]
MQTFTVEIKNDNALKVLQDLQKKHHINILSKPDLNSPIFPGEPLTAEEFRSMIEKAENSGSMSLKEGKAKWSRQRKELIKLSR